MNQLLTFETNVTVQDSGDSSGEDVEDVGNLGNSSVS